LNKIRRCSGGFCMSVMGLGLVFELLGKAFPKCFGCFGRCSALD
jgi:hypothetical protein